MSEFKQYRRNSISEMRPYVPGEVLRDVRISTADLEMCSPTAGDMVERDPKNHRDQWIMSAQYFAENFDATPVGADAAVALGERAFLR